jgi:hypothetical protein
MDKEWYLRGTSAKFFFVFAVTFSRRAEQDQIMGGQVGRWTRPKTAIGRKNLIFMIPRGTLRSTSWDIFRNLF